MSETTTEPPVAENTAPAPEQATTQQPVETTQGQETEQQVEHQAGEQETQPHEETKPEKPNRSSRHVAQLTARNAAIAAELEETRKRAEAAEKLLSAGKDDGSKGGDNREEIEREVAREIAKRESTRQLNSLIEDGRKSFGAKDWDQKAAIIHSLGGTQNPAFMEALVAMPNAARLAGQLADDADALVALLNKSPVAMAAEMGRMAADMSRPAPKPISNAPRPITPISTPAVVAEPDVYDESLSMRDWSKAWDKRQAARRAERMASRG